MISIIIPRFLQMECSHTSKYPYVESFAPLDVCIKSIKKQTYKDKEIIFTDFNRKNDDGFLLRNAAVKKSRGDIILFLCPEAIFTNNHVLSDLIETFKDSEADAVVGSSFANKKLDKYVFTWLICLEYEERERQMGTGWTDVGATSYFAIKRSVFDEVGGFPKKSPTIDTDNRWFNTGFHDWDFCMILNKKGYRIWHTYQLSVYHIYQTTFFGLLKKQFHQAWYRVAYLKVHGKGRDKYTNRSAFFPPIWKFYKGTKDKRVFLLLLIIIPRYFSWLCGILKGAYDFYLK